MKPGAFDPAPLDRLFESSDLSALDAEDLEEFVVESLGLALFVVGVFPFLRELGRPVPYLIPRKANIALGAAVASVI